MDVVYLFDSRTIDVKPLLLSVESVCRHYDFRRIFIIGSKPPELDEITQHFNKPKVVHIPHGEELGRNENQSEKIRVACQDRRISKKFVLMNDDFYFLEETKEIPYYHIGTLRSWLPDNRAEYKRHQFMNQEWMDYIKAIYENNPNGNFYEAHYPIILEKKIVQKILKQGIFRRQYYCEIAGIKGKFTKDFKLYDTKKINQALKRPFISTGPATETPEVLARITVRMAGHQEWLNWRHDEVSVSYNIMAHPKRARYVKEILRVLGEDIPVIWDDINNVWDTRRRCLENHIEQGKDYCLTIQDDVIVTKEFKRDVNRFINWTRDKLGVKEAIYNFYFAKNRWRCESFIQGIKDGYVKLDEFVHEPCLAFPTKYAQAIIDYGEENQATSCAPLTKVLVGKIPTYFSMPSLADHRTIKSLWEERKGKSNKGRVSWWFIKNKWDEHLEFGTVRRVDSSPINPYNRKRKWFRRSGTYYKHRYSVK